MQISVAKTDVVASLFPLTKDIIVSFVHTQMN